MSNYRALKSFDQMKRSIKPRQSSNLLLLVAVEGDAATGISGYARASDNVVKQLNTFEDLVLTIQAIG